MDQLPDESYKEKYSALAQQFAEFKESLVPLIQAERLNALREFTSGLAHDLNQPINVTKIICQGILRDIEKNRFSLEDAKIDLPEILNQMNRLADMVSQMRSIYRRPKGIVKEKNDINVPVRSVLKLILEQYKNHHVGIVEHLSEGLPAVLIDASAMEQVCYNLLSNARFAVEKSGKTPMTIEVKTSLGPDGKEVFLEVVDNGIGIVDDIKNKIFEPFFTTKGPGEGIGLGLAVCQNIVKDHQGRIELESKSGEGSRFKVILPANLI
ncbi:MAG: hypothetical protein HQL24_00010 [Candidatus Omnitrophica bacterium]|nr:hypothetical protein [Candidatus Omnitrophota bacterium]